jgi:hypothetical protein
MWFENNHSLGVPCDPMDASLTFEREVDNPERGSPIERTFAASCQPSDVIISQVLRVD